jgi:dipeptidyl aminopeptidase/acylaminoacyl peptidase
VAPTIPLTRIKLPALVREFSLDMNAGARINARFELTNATTFATMHRSLTAFFRPMRQKTLSLVLIALISWFTPNGQAETVPASALYANASITNMKIAPDGRHVAFTFEEGTEVRVAIMNLDSQKITALPGIGERQHVLNFWWSSNRRVVMSVGEVTGYLDNMGRPGRLYAADIDGRRREQLHDGQGASVQVLHPLPDDPDHILIARRHWADGGTPKAHRLNTYRRTTQYLADQPDSRNIIQLLADNAGELRVAAEYIPGPDIDSDELNLFVKHGEEWRQLPVETERQPVSIQPLGFSADNSQAYFLSNHDMPENDRMGAFRYDFESNQLELLYRHDEVDISGGIYGHDGEVLGVTARFGPMNYVFFDELAESNDDAILLQRLALSFPGQDVTLTSFSRDGSKAIIFARGDRNPGEFYLFDLDTMQARFLAATLPEVPKDQLQPMEAVRIEARDGLVLHGLLTRPAGREANLPLIVEVHGGPFGVADHWGFRRDAQFFAQHGYATLNVNFRGSGNRGDDFVRLGRQGWGGVMQDDVTDATRWAIEQGIADPERICIAGGSYGGYATLMGVIREPELYQCGVGIVGVYDLPWFRGGDGNDWSSQRGRQSRSQREQWMSAHIGDDEDFLRQNSPVHNVDQIQAELFIVHGGSDVRVVVGHAERLREALDGIGKSYEWMLKEEEGHGFYSVDNRVELAERMLRFFNRHIGPNANAARAD